MTTSISFEISGLPPTEGDDGRASVLISEAKTLIRKCGFTMARNQGVKLSIEFQARSASGISDPLNIITGILIALQKAGAYPSRSAIRDLSFTRKTGEETKYSIRVSRVGNE